MYAYLTAPRRSFLRIGGLLPFGVSFLGAGGSAVANEPRTVGRAKRCILLWLDGGPSHLEMFDPKPELPVEMRGPFAAISTSVPGVQISEMLPQTAKLLHHVAVIRSMTSPLGEHGIANHYMLTGYKPTQQLDHPSFGAVVAKLTNAESLLPKFIAIPEVRSSLGAGFLGTEFAAFETGGDPSRPDFRVRDLEVYAGLDDMRIERRKRILGQLDQLQSTVESGQVKLDSGFEQAFRLISSPQAKRAFDLNEESPANREKYGGRSFGQSCLMARRLAERDVPFVSVVMPSWDTHENLVLNLRDGYSGAKVGVGLIPTFDQAFAALIGDLHERNMLDDTLVVAMGEFGRTPKLNTRGGRDHWPRVFSVVVAGAGIPGGQTIGASDRIGESPATRPVNPADLARSIYKLLGVNPDSELYTQDGRPVQINQGGKEISELFG
jgi:Protein of unknown function (DUF1501)